MECWSIGAQSLQYPITPPDRLTTVDFENEDDNERENDPACKDFGFPSAAASG